MSSEDITFCGYFKCPNIDCERHVTHATGLYNSFAYFHNCDKYPPMEFSEEELQKLKETINENSN